MKNTLYVKSFEGFIDKIYSILLDYSPKLISAIIILIIGLYAIRLLNRLVRKLMLKREFEPTLSKFLADSLLWTLRGLLFITFISKLGIETSSFVAILGAVGLAIGLSLQGSLSNFAGGMLIILFKPFRVGDTIEAQTVVGTVSEIQIFVTKLITANNQAIFIPNGILSNGVIVNYSTQGIRRADLIFSLSHTTNIKNAKNIVMQVMQNNPLVLSSPSPEVIVKNFTETSIQLAARPWAKNDDYEKMSAEILEKCKENFDDAGILV